MMKTIDIVLNRPGTSARVYQLAFKDPCRIIEAAVCLEVAQAAAAPISLGKAGAASTIFDMDLDGTAAGACKVIPFTTGVTEGNKNQIFNRTTPLVLTVDLAADSTIHLQLTVDPFVIGPHKGSAATAS